MRRAILKKVQAATVCAALVVAALAICVGCSTVAEEVKSTAEPVSSQEKEVSGQEDPSVKSTESTDSKANKADLILAIAEQESMTDAVLECFSDQSVEVFKEALENARQIAGDEAATQNEVDEASLALTTASDKLEIDFDADDYQTVKWEKLARYPEKYENKPVALKGEVFQYEDGILDEEGTEYAQVLVSSVDDYSDNTLLTIPLERLDGRLLEGDVVTAYGRYAGLYSYETVLGAQASVPNIIVYHIEVGDRS